MPVRFVVPAEFRSRPVVLKQVERTVVERTVEVEDQAALIGNGKGQAAAFEREPRGLVKGSWWDNMIVVTDAGIVTIGMAQKEEVRPERRIVRYREDRLERSEIRGHCSPPGAVERPSSVVGPSGKKSCHEKSFGRPVCGNGWFGHIL